MDNNEIKVSFSGAQLPILLITCGNHVYVKTTVTSSSWSAGI